ncbi:MAG: small multi-drug export protein [Candidatus Thermoplasmatota archaeon]|nr:small multi-drug export protein [Candidatus Thermoplasmatota archaeon]
MAPAEHPEPLAFFTSTRKATLFVRVTLPLAAMAGLIASIPLVFPERTAEFFGFLTAYIVPPAGKESVIPAAVGAGGFPPLLVATYIAGLDMTLAWFLAWNWDMVTRIPLAGRWLDDTMEKGRDRLERFPLLDRSAFLGLTLFVYFPLQGSGALIGVILGRMIGMPPQRAWVAIMVGALLAAFSWAYAANAYAGAITAFGGDTVLQGTLVVISTLALLTLITRRLMHD